MFKKNDFVRITRLANIVPVQNPSLPAGYTIEGIIAEDPVAGDTFKVYRTKRNGITVPGLFESSPMQAVTEHGFVTQNSFYVVDIIPMTESDQEVLETLKILENRY